MHTRPSIPQSAIAYAQVPVRIILHGREDRVIQPVNVSKFIMVGFVTDRHFPNSGDPPILEHNLFSA